MKDKEIRAAMAEAKRFLARADAYWTAMRAREGYLPPRESGALRRASLDLTRALAEMRKP